MDKLRGIEYFVRVVKAGSFARAARELEVSPPAVTKMINALERTLGVKLLTRDSRKLGLTADGEQYLAVCANTLAELRAVENRLESGSTLAAGKLVVGLSRTIGPPFVAGLVAEFLERHPAMSLELKTVNSPSDPVAAGVDVIVSVRWPEESSLVAKRIGQMSYVTCASPSYLQAHGTPTDPDDLRNHVCLAYRNPQGMIHDLWKYERRGETRSVAVAPQVVGDDAAALREACARGVGVLWMLDINARTLVDQGRVVAILNDWASLDGAPFHALYRRGAGNSGKVRAFVDFLANFFAAWEPRRSVPLQHLGPMPRYQRRNWTGSRAQHAGAR
ncbi:MAG TPA: LysR family transcriptional regulator [Burkholderiales bacterium]|nr:LysR family transcriptional regulator [Burkholderiales bacterium]